MPGCPPATDIEPLPPHLKDALRRVLLKRGAVTGGELGCLLHPGVEDLDLSDCQLSYQHLAALTHQQHLRSATHNLHLLHHLLHHHHHLHHSDTK